MSFSISIEPETKLSNSTGDLHLGQLFGIENEHFPDDSTIFNGFLTTNFSSEKEQLGFSHNILITIPLFTINKSIY